MNIYETKHRAIIKNPPPPTTTSGEGGGGVLDLPCTKGHLLKDAKLFCGTTKYQKFLLSLKINLFE